MSGKQRRSPGQGGVYAYQTGAGQRWRIKCVVTREDGTKREINRRGFRTESSAHTALRNILAGLAEETRPTGWDCLVLSCYERAVTRAPVLLCADHRDLLLAQYGNRKRTHEPLVYILRNGNRAKIGWTTNLKRRIEQLSLPPSAVMATMPGGPAEEAELHARFASSRVHDRYEWFEVTPELEAFTDSLAEVSKLRVTALEIPGGAVNDQLSA
jgi:hypothetical protein